jgi:hypothetical protein
MRAKKIHEVQAGGHAITISINAQETRVEVHQQWEGVVSSIDGDEFSVVLRDLTHPDGGEHEAVLPIEEIPEDDLPLLQVGAVLYWTIGYRQSRTGQRDRVSSICLRKSPAWTRADIARVQREARALDDLWEWREREDEDGEGNK